MIARLAPRAGPDEQVPLALAAGRILAANVAADRDNPRSTTPRWTATPCAWQISGLRRPRGLSSIVRRRWPDALTLLLIANLAVVMFSTAVFIGNARYHFPLYPWLILSACSLLPAPPRSDDAQIGPAPGV
jgi:hypothetical protein